MMFMVLKCKECGLRFEEKRRLDIHKQVHGRKPKISEYGSPEFNIEYFQYGCKTWRWSEPPLASVTTLCVPFLGCDGFLDPDFAATFVLIYDIGFCKILRYIRCSIFIEFLKEKYLSWYIVSSK
jgi:hypothetical protein